MPWSNDNTGSEGTSGGETDDAHAAPGQDDEDEDAGGIHVERGQTPRPMARSSLRTKTRGRDETQMFAAGRLDTIYLLWESPSGKLSRDAGYSCVPS